MLFVAVRPESPNEQDEEEEQGDEFEGSNYSDNMSSTSEESEYVRVIPRSKLLLLMYV